MFVEYRAVAQFRPPLFILEKPAPAIHADALASCRVFPDREALLAAVAVGKTAAEVGTQHGYWARHILQTLQPDVLHLFDYGFDWLAQDVRDHPRVSLHSGDSSTSLWKMPDGFFDWIYIDADHSYEGVCKDAVAAAFKIRADGVLIFNDYTLWSPLEAIPYGTVACVNEMLSSGDWNAIGLALTPTGYYDIALQRKPPVV